MHIFALIWGFGNAAVAVAEGCTLDFAGKKQPRDAVDEPGFDSEMIGGYYSMDRSLCAWR